LDTVNGRVCVAAACGDGEAEDVIREHVIGSRVISVVIVDLGVVDRNRAGFPNRKVCVRVEREDGVSVGNHGSVSAGGPAGDAEPWVGNCHRFAEGDDDVIGLLCRTAVGWQRAGNRGSCISNRAHIGWRGSIPRGWCKRFKINSVVICIGTTAIFANCSGAN